MLRDTYGFDITCFAAPGPLLELIQEKRLNYRPAPGGPSLKRMLALRDVARIEKPDLEDSRDVASLFSLISESFEGGRSGRATARL